ncbi:type I-E CRISPR-associated protein Cse2/CasB [Legionella sp. CNM-4043-24]|uniref:type I-E CRISPR-associated protein Cse2/CasB n=1 Tax=Legionella sp. CNM-4043-24 TaxID=3421646 RepID=UPI00403AA259
MNIISYINNQVNSSIMHWWQSISPLESGKNTIQSAPTSYRAELRRCETSQDALFTAAFRSLWFSLPENLTKEANEHVMECFGIIAILLAHVNCATSDNLACAAGRKNDSGKSTVSELRFAQLQQARSVDELLRRARRILKQLKGEVSPILLANDIVRWFHEQYQPIASKADKRIVVQWAMDYYRAAASK